MKKSKVERQPSGARAPGHPEARRLGCLCPVIDNNRGRGMYQDIHGRPVFVYTEGCPMHDAAARPVERRPQKQPSKESK